MKRFVEGEDRLQGALLPHCLDDYVTENNPVRVIEAFIDELDLATLGFEGVFPAFVRSNPSSSLTTIISIAMMASSTSSPRARMIAPREMRSNTRPVNIMMTKRNARVKGTAAATTIPTRHPKLTRLTAMT